MNQSTTRSMAVLTAGAMALAGCQTMPGAPAGQAAPAPVAAATGPGGCKPLPGTQPKVDATQAGLIGGALGAVAGGVIGRNSANNRGVGTRNGALLGAVAGALAGTAYANSVGVSETADGAVKLNVPGSVLFPTGSYTLAPGFKTTLDSVAGTIKEYCGVTAKVVGHTDNVGNYASNKTLSENRAQAVVTHLVAQGVSPTALTSEGLADSQPIAANTDANGRQQNRRVEAFIRPPAQ